MYIHILEYRFTEPSALLADRTLDAVVPHTKGNYQKLVFVKKMKNYGSLYLGMVKTLIKVFDYTLQGY